MRSLYLLMHIEAETVVIQEHLFEMKITFIVTS